jgi:hypothetical protein
MGTKMRKPTVRRNGEKRVTVTVDFHLNVDDMAAFYWGRYVQQYIPDTTILNGYVDVMDVLPGIQAKILKQVGKRSFLQELKDDLWVRGNQPSYSLDCPESLDTPRMSNEVFLEVVAFLREAVLPFTSFD